MAEIPARAFYTCNSLKGISIPGSVERIGVNAFENDSLMTTVTIAEGVKAIDQYAFHNCSGVTSITLPASLDSIHANALQFMNSVTSFSIADGDTPLKVYGTRYWGNGMCNDFAPYEGHLGRDLTLTQNALSPFYHAANNEGGLTKLTIGNKVTDLPEEAFYNNRNLTEATIGNNLAEIPARAFYTCNSLKGISIPGSVERIGVSAFGNDSLMTTVTIAEGVKAIDRAAFSYCGRVKSITLPASLDSIHANALQSMSGVTSFSIADSDTPLKVYGTRFYGNGMCYDFALADAYVGRDITLTHNALSPFYNQQSVTEVTLGDKVTALVSEAFYYCKALKKVTVNAVIPPAAPVNSFNGVDITKIPLFVPEGTVAAYKVATIWKEFMIQGDQEPGDVNGDGEINAGDVSSLYSLILSGSEYNPAYDLNGDGEINAGDVSLLYGKIIGQ